MAATQKRGCHYIIVIANWLTKMGQVVLLRNILLVDFNPEFLEHSIYKYGPPKSLLSGIGKHFIYTLFQNEVWLLKTTSVFITTYQSQTNRQVEQ